MKKLLSLLAMASSLPLFGFERIDIEKIVNQEKQRFEEYRKWKAGIQDIVDNVEKRSGLKNLMIVEAIFPNEKMEALYQNIMSDGIKKGITPEIALNKTIVKSRIEWASLFSKIFDKELDIAQKKLNSLPESPYGLSVKGYLDVYSQLPYWKQLLFSNQKKKIEKEYNDQLEALQKQRDKMVTEVNTANVFLWMNEMAFKEKYES